MIKINYTKLLISLKTSITLRNFALKINLLNASIS